MSDQFVLSFTIDPAGIVLYGVKGAFDLSQWLPQHRAALQKFFGGRFDETRPVVVDIRELQAPKGEWILLIKELFRHLDVFGETRARCAFISGDSPGRKFMCDFYIKCRRAFKDDGRELRAFQRWDDGYAWASADYLVPGA